MPNYCECKLEISGDKKQIDALLTKAKSDKSDFSIEQFCPTPPELMVGEGWYDWRIENWSTKWDLGDVEIKDRTPHEDDPENETVTLRFQTAWSPPSNAFDKISKEFPFLHFTLNYAEPGMDFCGVSDFENGLVDDRTCSYNEQYNVEINFVFDEAKLEDDILSIPVHLQFKEDPEDFDSEDVDRRCILKMPVDLEAGDVFDRYDSDIDLLIEDGDDFKDTIFMQKDSLINEIEENLPLIKKTAHHHTLQKQLPVNEVKRSKNKYGI